MTNKEWLNRSRITAKVINSISETLSHSDNKVLRTALAKKKKKLYQIQNEIYSSIDKIEDDKYFVVLYERYIALKTWEQIAEDNHYSIRHVYRLHGEALKRVKIKNSLKFNV